MADKQQPIDLSEVFAIFKKNPSERTQTDIKKIIAQTKQIPFFKKYIEEGDKDVHEKCCRCMRLEFVQNKEPVFQIDTVGTKFYLIVQGKVGVYIRLPRKMEIEENKPIEDSLTCVKELQGGEAFGELALLNNKPRLASIISHETTYLAVLDKKDFGSILKEKEESKLIKEMEFFSSLPLFSGWNFNLVKLLYLNVFKVKFLKNDFVFKVGEEPLAVYIIKQGEFDIQVDFEQENKTYSWEVPAEKDIDSLKMGYKKNKTSLRITSYVPYEIFGEEDIISNSEKRTISVVCQSSVGECIMIKKRDFFLRIMKDEGAKQYLTERLENKNQRLIDKKVKITSQIKGYSDYFFSSQDKIVKQKESFASILKTEQFGSEISNSYKKKKKNNTLDVPRDLDKSIISDASKNNNDSDMSSKIVMSRSRILNSSNMNISSVSRQQQLLKFPSDRSIITKGLLSNQQTFTDFPPNLDLSQSSESLSPVIKTTISHQNSEKYKLTTTSSFGRFNNNYNERVIESMSNDQNHNDLLLSSKQSSFKKSQHQTIPLLSPPSLKEKQFVKLRDIAQVNILSIQEECATPIHNLSQDLQIMSPINSPKKEKSSYKSHYFEYKEVQDSNFIQDSDLKNHNQQNKTKINCDNHNSILQLEKIQLFINNNIENDTPFDMKVSNESFIKVLKVPESKLQQKQSDNPLSKQGLSLLESDSSNAKLVDLKNPQQFKNKLQIFQDLKSGFALKSVFDSPFNKVINQSPKAINTNKSGNTNKTNLKPISCYINKDPKTEPDETDYLESFRVKNLSSNKKHIKHQTITNFNNLSPTNNQRMNNTISCMKSHVYFNQLLLFKSSKNNNVENNTQSFHNKFLLKHSISFDKQPQKLYSTLTDKADNNNKQLSPEKTQFKSQHSLQPQQQQRFQNYKTPQYKLKNLFNMNEESEQDKNRKFVLLSKQHLSPNQRFNDIFKKRSLTPQSFITHKRKISQKGNTCSSQNLQKTSPSSNSFLDELQISLSIGTQFSSILKQIDLSKKVSYKLKQ